MGMRSVWLLTFLQISSCVNYPFNGRMSITGILPVLWASRSACWPSPPIYTFVDDNLYPCVETKKHFNISRHLCSLFELKRHTFQLRPLTLPFLYIRLTNLSRAVLGFHLTIDASFFKSNFYPLSIFLSWKVLGVFWLNKIFWSCWPSYSKRHKLSCYDAFSPHNHSILCQIDILKK